jgi:phosphatidate phosphatase
MTILKLGKVYPFQRGFFCTDNSVKYPYHDSTIPSRILAILGLGLPIFSVSKSAGSNGFVLEVG